MWFLFLIWFILYCRFYDAVKNYFSSAYYKFVAIMGCKFDAFFPGFSKIFFIFNIHFPSKLPRFHSIKFFKLRIWITNSLNHQHKKCYNNASCLMIFVFFIFWVFLSKTLLRSLERAGNTGWWMNKVWMNE